MTLTMTKNGIEIMRLKQAIAECDAKLAELLPEIADLEAQLPQLAELERSKNRLIASKMRYQNELRKQEARLK